ncbi:Protein CBG15749 [Caenorhabditis briggsae]|uniref:Protein CBG15749 n=1 Tax=Caenorhabditis briggsae TaxID=6238 RepID=A8XMP8_CAEBR|nr:Protein CBG15749 [Caenorhabditis briggsae]CAP33924.1 Protein CBG15749 [Caenorhabditis briggsae]
MLDIENMVPAEATYVPHKKPYRAYCPRCQTVTTTVTHRKCGLLNLLLFILCLFLPCFFVFCFWCKCFEDIEHECPECKTSVGRRDRI